MREALAVGSAATSLRCPGRAAQVRRRIWGAGARHEVSRIGGHGLAGLSTSMVTMRPR